MKLSDAEWTVMNAVWAKAPASARDVLDRVERETAWAYTTVKTILDRLVEKGALAVTRHARGSAYEPRLTQDQARREAVRSLLDRAFDGAFGSLVAHAVADEKLSERDREALARIAQQLDGGER